MSKERVQCRRALVCIAVAMLLSVGGGAEAATTDSANPAPSTSGKLAGRLLVAAPGMPDPRFARTVIFMLHHDDKGAIGVIVNRPVAVEPVSKLLERLDGKGPPVGGGHAVRTARRKCCRKRPFAYPCG